MAAILMGNVIVDTFRYQELTSVLLNRLMILLLRCVQTKPSSELMVI